jgi:hypothetical protein
MWFMRYTMKKFVFTNKVSKVHHFCSFLLTM